MYTLNHIIVIVFNCSYAYLHTHDHGWQIDYEIGRRQGDWEWFEGIYWVLLGQIQFTIPTNTINS